MFQLIFLKNVDILFEKFQLKIGFTLILFGLRFKQRHPRIHQQSQIGILNSHGQTRWYLLRVKDSASHHGLS
jgi:hypothetical protein